MEALMHLLVATLSVLGFSFVFAMLGLGGAMLYVPLLHWLGYDFKEVVIPTSLLLNGITVISAAIIYHRAKMIDYQGSIPLVISSFLGAPIGAYLTHWVPIDTLITLFALAMLFAGVRMLISSGQAEKEQMVSLWRRRIFMAIGGLGIGSIAGLLGIGGGFLFVPLMLSLGYSTKIAAATSSFVVIFCSFAGYAGHVAKGHFNWPLMLSTSLAVFVGGILGASVMKEKMKAWWIKLLFAIVLLGVAVKMLWKCYV
jgi:hypothetical protein